MRVLHLIDDSLQLEILRFLRIQDLLQLARLRLACRLRLLRGRVEAVLQLVIGVREPLLAQTAARPPFRAWPS